MCITRQGEIYLTVIEAAREFHYHPASLSRLVQQGKVEHIFRHNRYNVKSSDLRNYAQTQQKPLSSRAIKAKTKRTKER
jgi:hypothetical protein